MTLGLRIKGVLFQNVPAQTPQNYSAYVTFSKCLQLCVCVRELMILSGSIRSCFGEVSAAGADK